MSGIIASSMPAQRAVKAYYPATPGYGLIQGESPRVSNEYPDFDTFAIHLARHNAWCFFRHLIRIYHQALKKGLRDALGEYPRKSQFHILGIMGCHMERMCAAEVDFSSPDKLSAYKERITAARNELFYMPPDDLDRVRRLFCDLLRYRATDLKQNKTEPPMEREERVDSPMNDDAGMDIDTEVTPASPSPLSSQQNPDAALMDVDTEATPAAPSLPFSQPAPDASLDNDMNGIEFAEPESCSIAGTAGSSATDVAATRDDTAMQIDSTSTEVVEVAQEPTGVPGSSQNDAQVQGPVGSSAQVTEPAEVAQDANSRRIRMSPTDRLDEAYRRERQGGMPFTFNEREFLEDQVPNEDRTRLLQQIFSTLKQENDGWTNRHRSLGISDWRLERWAIKLEDEVAKEADENFPDPETWMPTELTDKVVYDRGARRIVAGMQDPLDFFKNTVRRLMRQITFVEDDKPVIFVKSPVERNLAPRPWALGGDATFHTGSKRKVDSAFDRRDIVRPERDIVRAKGE
ncbi:hypothetical protein P171DRAFT_483890 [Karstenula rhodostoma CBS 690.94]|uniref:Uncharacterized protein n=1 Tax=Karstenula rhodostoma CBS 690.94 TaxID=1392251 RepID=A0A9P4UDW1_9PLEO|nr:hypothetical protein P171DRAFT_483890 [Karstenula rhodostoma CBS 690.94]